MQTGLVVVLRAWCLKCLACAALCCLRLQDELIEMLRSDGRRQAAHRMLRQKRDGASGQQTDDEGPSSSAPLDN